MSDLLAHVRTFIDQHKLFPVGARIVVGVSGGADSLVLLHVLLRLRDERDLMLHAATLDHGLRGEASAADAEFVGQITQAWGVPVTVERADVEAYAAAHGLGIEAAARNVRYAFLARVAQAFGTRHIAVGHNRDDQAETVLLHLLRGTGLRGLRGMLPRALLSPRAGQGASQVLIRPLLDISRAEIDAYAAALDLHPREDTTNQDPAYLRNRVRHEVLPLLETINPAVCDALVRLADVVRVDHDLLMRVGETAVTRVLQNVQDVQHGIALLDRAAWKNLHPGEKRYVLRSVIALLRRDASDITFTHITDAIRVADAGQVGAQAALPGDLMLRVDYDVLVLARSTAAAVAVVGSDAPGLERVSGPVFNAAHQFLQDVGDWVFDAHPLGAGDDLNALHADPLAAALQVPAGAQLHLRRREAGDRFQPRGMGGRSQKLSDMLVNMRVPAAWRDRVSLLTVDGVIAWFVAPTQDGLRGRVAEPFAVRDGILPKEAVIVVVRWRRI